MGTAVHRLMRNMRRRIFILSVIGWILGAAAPAFAQEKTETLMDLENPDNIIVALFYEKEEPEVKFLSPSKKEYGEELGNLRVERNQGAVYFYLPDAEAGTWFIWYDQKGNETVDIDYNPYVEPLEISSFTVEQTGEDRIKARFQADYPAEASYQYSLSAVLTDETGAVTGRRELETGRAPAGELVERELLLDNLSAYDSYYLELEAWYKPYSLETWDVRVAEDAFRAAGGGELEAVQGMKIQIDRTDGTALLDWSEYGVSCDHYLVALWDEAHREEEPYFFQEVQGEQAVRTGIPENCDVVRVELTYFGQNGRASLPCVRQVDLHAAECTLVTEENTASAQAVIAYEAKARVDAELFVNEESQALQLTGTGQISVNLAEFQNEIRISCKPDAMTELVYHWRVYSDRIAPNLRLYEEMDGITVDSGTFTLVGETEAGCVLTINGESVAVSEDGTFLWELPLKRGENPVEILATDLVGNQSRMYAVLYRGTPETAKVNSDQTGGVETWISRHMPLFFSLFIGTAAALSVVLTLMAEEKRRRAGKGNEGLLLRVLRNLCLAGAVSTVLAAAWFVLSDREAQRAVSSTQFLIAAETSATAAYELLQGAERYGKLKGIALAAVLGLTAGGVFFELLRRFFKRK